ncbi:hypothetical protein BGW38_007895, partial [Lunasporangiospora selenospora]
QIVEVQWDSKRRKVLQGFYYIKEDMLVMEYVDGGSLTDAIVGGTIVDWDTKARIAKEITLGLIYLHGLDIIHCDIKSANILLNRNKEVKICDFGRARPIGQGGGGGTLPWMAPELLQDPSSYSSKSDVYALGLVMWQMASGRTQPFQEHTVDGMIFCIINGYMEDFPEDTPEFYATCIQECWHRLPEERLSPTKLLQDIKSAAFDSDVDNLQISMEEKGHSLQDTSNDVNEEYLNICNHLGLLYSNGKGVRKNPAKAMEWFLKASDGGDANASFNLGKLYLKERDYDNAMKRFLKASDSGFPQAACGIGILYEEGYGVEQDYTKAMEWYIKANDGGDHCATYNIGLMYHDGHGVEQDFSRAMEWYLKASDAGVSASQYNIGLMYHQGHGVEQDFSRAMEWYLKASDAGRLEAQNNIGFQYYNGQSVEQDYDKAMECFLKASNGGCIEAQRNIGNMYMSGLGVEQDYGKAIEWFLKAGAGGNEGALFNIGNMYLKGQGVERDYGKAMEWFLKAKDSGSHFAMYSIGCMYLKGQGIEQDLDKGIKWIIEASDYGNPDAILHLGEMFGTLD